MAKFSEKTSLKNPSKSEFKIYIPWVVMARVRYVITYSIPIEIYNLKVF